MSNCFATRWALAHRAPLMWFPRWEYWSGLPFPSPGESFQPKDQIYLSFINRWILYYWATREAQSHGYWPQTQKFAIPSEKQNHLSSVTAWPLVTTWTAVHQASLSITNSRSLLKLMSMSGWCHPTILSSVVPFSSCLQSFPASGSFSMSQFFASGGQSIEVSVSASVLPMNNQDWFPLGWMCLIVLSKGLSRVFSNTTVQKHKFFGSQLSS